MDGPVEPRAVVAKPKVVAWSFAVALPLAGLVLLLAKASLDVRWEHHPAHFWLVLGVAATNAVLAYATGDAARRRGDARVFLVSLGFVSSAGFLLLHALATPGALLEGPNTGFMIATPVGLTIAGFFFAASALRMGAGARAAVVRAMTTLRFALIAFLVAWGVVSVAELPPLNARPLGRGSAPLVALAVVGITCFATSAIAYARLYLRRASRLVASVLSAAVLLAEAMGAVAFSRNWHTSWWEWHVLMLVAFAIVAWAARTEWRQERFVDLYLEDTAAGQREVSVMFADLAGFTSYSERHDPRQVSEMLNAFLEVAVPAVVRSSGGEIDEIIGDAIMVTFNTRGDQPDHAERAARAALSLRDAVGELTRRHPDWPKLRIGVNTGEALVGIVGTEGGRKYTVVGDAINLAARLEQSAPPGEVVVGAATLEKVPGAQVERLEPFEVKGKSKPVEAYLLTGLRETRRTP